MRCPACGAHNTDRAEWCGQCYAPLRETPAPVHEPTREPVDDATAPPEPSEPARDRVSPEPASTVVGTDARFRHTDEGIDWRCARCEHWNPIERRTCSTCGAAFTETMDAAEDGDGAGARFGESIVTVATGALPGLGHILLGATIDGAARLVTYVLWLAGGVLMLVEAIDTGGPVLPSLPLLLGAAVVWIASLVDVVNLARGRQQQVLRPRVLLWLVVVVVGGLMLSFLASASRVGLG